MTQIWYYKGQPFDESMVGDNVGFVYLILNQTNNRMYIGQKLFKFKKTRMVNKKAKRFMVPSDWTTYTGSNTKLNNDIAAGHVVHKLIIHLCTKKSHMNYLELKEQIVNDALVDKQYYNEYCGGRISSKQLGINK